MQCLDGKQFLNNASNSNLKQEQENETISNPAANPSEIKLYLTVNGYT